MKRTTHCVAEYTVQLQHVRHAVIVSRFRCVIPSQRQCAPCMVIIYERRVTAGGGGGAARGAGHLLEVIR